MIPCDTSGLEEHLEDCWCDSFSDSYKDVNGFRPRGIWTCLQIKQWHDEEYTKTGENTWTPNFMLVPGYDKSKH